MNGSRGLIERFCWRDRESLISSKAGPVEKVSDSLAKGGVVNYIT